jgi:hypothetical protein
VSQDPNLTEGRRRLDQACDLIASAIRLGRISGEDVRISVGIAVSRGAEQLAEDIQDEWGGAK